MVSSVDQTITGKKVFKRQVANPTENNTNNKDAVNKSDVDGNKE